MMMKKVASCSSASWLAILVMGLVLLVAQSFQPTLPATTAMGIQHRRTTTPSFAHGSSCLHMMEISTTTTTTSSSSLTTAADTLDPTTFLSDLLSGLIGSNAILLVPIGAGLLVAFVIGFSIFAYANPEVSDD